MTEPKNEPTSDGDTEPDSEPEADETPTEALPPTEGEAYDTTISFAHNGITDAQLANIVKLIASKATLIRKALGLSPEADLRVDLNEDSISFPWFEIEAGSAVQPAHMSFLGALCNAACKQKRVNGTDREVESEKFAFRIFLVKLGMSGPTYAADRKALLANLSGNAAFPNYDKAREHAAKWKGLRQQARADRLANQAEDDASTAVSTEQDGALEADAGTDTDTNTDTE